MRSGENRQVGQMETRLPYREADFLITNERQPMVLVEATLSDEQPGKSLQAIQQALGIAAVQVVREATTYRTFDNQGHPLLVAPACSWVSGLPF